MPAAAAVKKSKTLAKLPAGLYLARVRGAFESSDPDFLRKFMGLDQVRNGYFGDMTVHRSSQEAIDAIQLVQADGFLITVSGNTLQYEFPIPQERRTNHFDSVKFFEDRLKGLMRILKTNHLGSANWLGVIFNFALPISSANSAASAIEQWLVNLKSPIILSKNLAMFKLQHGYVENGFNRHIFVDGYQIQHAQLGPDQSNLSMQQVQAVARVVEAGVGFVIDVNDKPRHKKGSIVSKFRAVKSHLVDNYSKWIDQQIKSLEARK